MSENMMENMLDELLDSSSVKDSFSISAFLSAAASRIGADVCFESTKSSAFSEANKRLTRIQLQLEHYEKRFAELKNFFDRFTKDINLLNQPHDTEKAEQLIELFIDFQKHNNEISAMLRTVAEYAYHKYIAEVFTAVNLIRTSAENINFIFEKISSNFETMPFYSNACHRQRIIFNDISNTVESTKKLLSKGET